MPTTKQAPASRVRAALGTQYCLYQSILARYSPERERVSGRQDERHRAKEGRIEKAWVWRVPVGQDMSQPRREIGGLQWQDEERQLETSRRLFSCVSPRLTLASCVL